jgi:hypothetical protein
MEDREPRHADDPPIDGGDDANRLLSAFGHPVAQRAGERSSRIEVDLVVGLVRV